MFSSVAADVFYLASTSQALLVLLVLLARRDLQALQELRSRRKFFSRSSKR